ARRMVRTALVAPADDGCLQPRRGWLGILATLVAGALALCAGQALAQSETVAGDLSNTINSLSFVQDIQPNQTFSGSFENTSLYSSTLGTGVTFGAGVSGN